MSEQNLLTDNDTKDLIARTIMEIGLKKGYCYTGKWYNLSINFNIPNALHVKLENATLKEGASNGQTKLL
jgi:TRAP-type mannitol/chloroaromatic compound transport system substrate-binding protein